MKKRDIVRAWRDPKFRRGLNAEEKAQLPTHPAEWMVGVEDDVLASVTGGCCYPGNASVTPPFCSALCSPCPPRHCY